MLKGGTMKLKLDAKGNVVIQDDKPVYVYDENGVEKEMVFDAPSTLSKIAALNKEAGDHRIAKNEALEKLKSFEGIDPEEAKSAIATVKNFDDKKLVDAGEVEKLKTEMSQIYETKHQQLTSDFESKVNEFQSTIEDQQGTIRDLLINNEFAKSNWFVAQGDKQAKTILPPDMGAKFFGDYFKIEKVKDGSLKPVGYLNGEIIRSTDPQKLGEPADFNTAVTQIIEQYPGKSQILRSTSGGAGTHGNNNHGDGGIITLSKDQAKNPDIYRAARTKAQETGAKLHIE